MPKARVPEADVRQQAKFVVTYDGDALKAGTMDVRALAPALLALGDLCDEANKQINADAATISVKVRGFDEGTFDVLLMLSYGLPVAAATIFSLKGAVSSVHDVLSLLFGKDFEDGGLVGLVKKLKNGKVTKVTQLENGVTKLEIDHRVTLDVSDRAYKMFTNPRVQKDLQAFVSPLKRVGIDAIEVRDEGKKEARQTISEDDLPAFDALSDVAAVVPSTVTSEVVRTYQVVSLSSSPRDKWKLTDQFGQVHVRVDDKTLYDRAKLGKLGIEPGFIVTVRIKSEVAVVNGERKEDNHLVEILDAHPPSPDATLRLFEEDSEDEPPLELNP